MWNSLFLLKPEQTETFAEITYCVGWMLAGDAVYTALEGQYAHFGTFLMLSVLANVIASRLRTIASRMDTKKTKLVILFLRKDGHGVIPWAKISDRDAIPLETSPISREVAIFRLLELKKRFEECYPDDTIIIQYDYSS